jgi:hypothetical protein
MDTAEQAELNRYRAEAATATVVAAVATSLAGRQLASAGAADQLTQLFAGDIKLVSVDGRQVAVGPGGVPVRDYVAAQLAKPEYTHFLAPSERGNAGRPAAAVAPGEAPRTMEQMFRQHVADQKKQGEDGRTNYRLPMPLEPAK